jgi:hypothetical protein
MEGGGEGREGGTGVLRDVVNNPLTGTGASTAGGGGAWNRRFVIQEDTIVEMSSHMASGESEMTGGHYESRESDDTTRITSASAPRIVRDSFSVPSLEDEC